MVRRMNNDCKPLETVFREMIGELIEKVRKEPDIKAISPEMIKELRESVRAFP